MTKEELEKEAYEYFKSICDDYNKEHERMGRRHHWVGFDIENAYIASAEPREKRIAELEAQIEEMKCCGNCENRYGQEKCADCHNYSKWKFKQAEQFYEEIVE